MVIELSIVLYTIVKKDGHRSSAVVCLFHGDRRYCCMVHSLEESRRHLGFVVLCFIPVSQ